MEDPERAFLMALVFFVVVFLVTAVVTLAVMSRRDTRNDAARAEHERSRRFFDGW
jgi:heme/copper-type cytochrome/quinol oxidase subunit 2